jgi:hypothetical protein
MGWKLDASALAQSALAQIDRVVTDSVRDPVGRSSWHLPPQNGRLKLFQIGVGVDAQGDGARTRVEERLRW